jgi:N-acyl-D-amino-acid deacylase
MAQTCVWTVSLVPVRFLCRLLGEDARLWYDSPGVMAIRDAIGEGVSMRTALRWCLVIGCSTLSGAAAQEPYDLVIRHGRVVDGTGNPWFQADVAVRGDRIVAVGRIPSGRSTREIDATGLVVAPGFIDMHSHSDRLLLEDGRAQSKIRQGVTTELLGEGSSAGPYQGELSPPEYTVNGQPRTWTTLGGYFAALEESPAAVNVASYVGLDNLWQSVMGKSYTRPTDAQFAAMEQLLDEALREGACGLSTMLAMPPGSLATTDDLVRLAKVVARHGGLYSSHIRNEGLGVLDAIREAIAVGERAGVRVDIIHVKIADQQLWGRMPEIVALIDAARQRGVDVQTNVYPYTRGNNNLASIIPPWAHEGGTAQMLSRLKSSADRERMKRDIREGIPGWYNHYTAVGGDWSRMLVSGRSRWEGLTMDRVLAARAQGKPSPPEPLEDLFDLLIEEGGSVPTVYAHHTDADMNLALQQPWCSIGSDGSAYAIDGPLRRGNPHPRNFGTFPRVLGVYVRETNLLTLEDAVRKMTSLNAAKIGLRDRGTIRVGHYADVTVFNPATVIDQSTYEAPFAYNVGIEYVIVNGQVALDRGEHTGAKPGRVLRVGNDARPLFEDHAQPQLLQERGAGEGPAWHPELGLLTSGEGHVFRRDRDGQVQIHRRDTGSNGLLFDLTGRLVMCEAAARRITRVEPDGMVTVLAAGYAGQPFNQPNDLTIDSRGRIYFSDPCYGDRSRIRQFDADGRAIEGVYRIDPDGAATRIITHQVDRPNGLVVAHDDRALFVADNNNDTVGGARKLWRFALSPDGVPDLASQRLVYDWKSTRGPDGMKLDAAGRLYVAAGLNRPNPPFETQDQPTAGIYVFSPDGELLQFVPIPRDETTNCAFGGDDLRTLYVTAGGSLWSLRTTTPGRPRWPVVK